MAITISKTWKVDGVLTDVTSATLRDPTDAFGVKRNDTGGIVVPSGTPMQHVSTGLYQYTFTEPEPNLEYTAYIEIVYEGATYRFEESLFSAASPPGMEMDYSTLRREIGRFLGYGRDPTAWTAEQTTDVEDILRSGLRRFYNPPPLPNEKYGWRWSFLRPIATLITVAGQQSYALPADCLAVIGPLSYEPGALVTYDAVELVPEVQVRLATARSSVTGRPTLAAVAAQSPNYQSGTRWELLLWPIPDGEYVLRYRYEINPAAIDLTNRLPPGAQAHAETILEACLAAAEVKMHDMPGVHNNLFQERLAASISRDRLAASPEIVGLRGIEEPYDIFGLWHDLDANLVTYKGQVY